MSQPTHRSGYAHYSPGIWGCPVCGYSTPSLEVEHAWCEMCGEAQVYFDEEEARRNAVSMSRITGDRYGVRYLPFYRWAVYLKERTSMSDKPRVLDDCEVEFGEPTIVEDTTTDPPTLWRIARQAKMVEGGGYCDHFVELGMAVRHKDHGPYSDVVRIAVLPLAIAVKVADALSAHAERSVEDDGRDT